MLDGAMMCEVMCSPKLSATSQSACMHYVYMNMK
jgi:hypothetical protein